jgi:hypothetical protein
MDIWQFQSKLTRRLLAWSALSIVAGVLMHFYPGRLVRGMAQQFVGWGLIDALIAIFGARAAERRASQLPDPLEDEITGAESRKLAKILWINTGLDLGYIAGGVALAATKGQKDPGWRGHGFGIIIQAGFLLIFDLFHALKIRAID